MITFNEARKRVSEAEGQLWKGPGTFFVSMDGREDDKAYWCVFGAEEWIIDSDPAYMMLDGGTALVDKKTGAVQLTQYLLVADRVDRMKPVSVG